MVLTLLHSIGDIHVLYTYVLRLQFCAFEWGGFWLYLAWVPSRMIEETGNLHAVTPDNTWRNLIAALTKWKKYPSMIQCKVFALFGAHVTAEKTSAKQTFVGKTKSHPNSWRTWTRKQWIYNAAARMPGRLAWRTWRRFPVQLHTTRLLSANTCWLDIMLLEEFLRPRLWHIGTSFARAVLTCWAETVG